MQKFLGLGIKGIKVRTAFIFAITEWVLTFDTISVLDLSAKPSGGRPGSVSQPPAHSLKPNIHITNNLEYILTRRSFRILF